MKTTDPSNLLNLCLDIFLVNNEREIYKTMFLLVCPHATCEEFVKSGLL